ncbi:5370_t:CDS:2 [Paraglomus brasilianum]|uniref:5370_t:CDS:1 n=1 Tax=Paraglomus brasilianum TaxID=144538 RepID=A0A9N9D082_9GLOM|nr:5370_t:CDS:2 [Paraglomus brasilianum]
MKILPPSLIIVTPESQPNLQQDSMKSNESFKPITTIPTNPINRAWRVKLPLQAQENKPDKQRVKNWEKTRKSSKISGGSSIYIHNHNSTLSGNSFAVAGNTSTTKATTEATTKRKREGFRGKKNDEVQEQTKRVRFEEKSKKLSSEKGSVSNLNFVRKKSPFIEVAGTSGQMLVEDLVEGFYVVFPGPTFEFPTRLQHIENLKSAVNIIKFVMDKYIQTNKIVENKVSTHNAFEHIFGNNNNLDMDCKSEFIHEPEKQEIIIQKSIFSLDSENLKNINTIRT